MRNESGGALIYALVGGVLLSTIAVYFSSRTVAMQKYALQLRVKTQAVNDRIILRQQLINVPLPAPGAP